MVSSTYKELIEQRRVVREEMPNFRSLPIAMEDDAALPDQDLIDASLAKVDEADAYVGLIGYRYGQTPVCKSRNPKEFSLTELEFRHAVERNLPICMFIMHDEYLIPKSALKEKRDEEKLRAFLELVKKDRIYAEFLSVEDLKPKVIKSLGRLREALENRAASRAKASVDADTKSPAKPLAESNIPIRVPEHFLGREDSLRAIASALAGKEGRVAITALHGLRGVGKTTLAAAYALNKSADYRATWWIRAQTPDTMRADLVALGVRLGWVGAEDKEEPALGVVKEKLRTDGERLLLIFDNANNAKELGPFLPQAGAAKLLITSTAPNWGGVAKPVEIEVWDKEVGAKFLIARTGRAKEPSEAEKLSEALGGLPLAHEQAAAYCERLGIGLGEYLKRFAASSGKLLDSEKDAPADYPLTVAKTLALAIEQAAKIHPAAEPLLVHAALLAPEPIPLFLFSEAREKFGEPLASLLAGDGLDEAIAALRAFALIDREEIADEREPEISFDTIRLHRLVREVAARRGEGENLVAARRALLEAVAAVYPRDVFYNPKTWPRARRLDALALALVGGGDEPQRGAEAEASYLSTMLASYRQGALAAYAQARLLFERALAIDEKTLGPEHHETATSLNNLALLLKTQGDVAAARPLYERVLRITEKALGPEHPNMATSLNNLALLLRDQGDLASAQFHLERALAIRKKVCGPEHPDTANSLNSVALLLAARGDHDGAQPLFERTLAICEKTLGPEDPRTNLTRGNLAQLLLENGDAIQALPLAEAARAAHEKILGPDHPWTKESALTTAAALGALGRGGEAAELRARFGV
jgi:tetratricopeptide (TPR) repeat protein